MIPNVESIIYFASDKLVIFSLIFISKFKNIPFCIECKHLDIFQHFQVYYLLNNNLVQFLSLY